MTDLAPSPKSPSDKTPGRGLKIALAVSLALNLAVVGSIAGFALRGGPDGHRSEAMVVRDLNFGPFTDALTRDQRRAMLRDFAEKGPGLREMRAQMRGDFDAVLQALRATPFDAGQFRAAIETQNARITERAGLGREALIARVVQMSDSERSEFLQRLEQVVSRHGNPRGRGVAD